jgi:hypothetical protein
MEDASSAVDYDGRCLRMRLTAMDMMFSNLKRKLFVSQSPKPHPFSPDTRADMSEDVRRLKDHLALQPLPTLRIFVFGAPGSGKRSVCEQLAHGSFPIGREPTEDGQYRRLLQLLPPEEGENFRVMLEWTTNLGDPREMTPDILQLMVRDNEAHILLYRTADRATFDAVEGLWREHIAGRTNGKVFVVANGEDEGVTQIEGKKLADRMGATFWPLSAQTGDGAGEEQLVAMARAVLLHRYEKG